jgi:hypothetical protein
MLSFQYILIDGKAVQIFACIITRTTNCLVPKISKSSFSLHTFEVLRRMYLENLGEEKKQMTGCVARPSDARLVRSEARARYIPAKPCSAGTPSTP